ncbi:hypothetical protein B0H16DRAFT_13595 [Mycena metata]|uniref:Uncharacterized protein n=1 Tax=Mycena metata TaxID=1033252 RepID=A0AAD7KHR9_9AGAR|nr:hypothetical protein B0H16DRAFT_13595 [Mycena metata]
MPTHTVFLKPRPFSRKFATEWIPAGIKYRPYLEDEGPPDEATDQRVFECSQKLESFLIEFHSLTLPEPPSLEHSNNSDLCTILVQCVTRKQEEWLFSLQERISAATIECYENLSAESREEISLGPPRPGNEQSLAIQIAEARICSMRNELIELKIWGCLFTVVYIRLAEWGRNMRELIRRHDNLHFCLVPLKFVGIYVKEMWTSNFLATDSHPREGRNSSNIKTHIS